MRSSPGVSRPSTKALKVASWASMAVVGGILVAGCGNVQLAGATAAASTGVSTTPQVQQTEPLVVEPTPAPTPVYNPPLAMGQLSAVVSSFDKPGFLGFMGTATAHVTVSNNTQVPLSGTLSVQFTDGGSPKGSPQTQQVSVDAGQSQQIDFQYKATFHFIDAASVSVTTMSSGGTSGMVGVPGMTVPGGYGAAPGYGSSPSSSGYGSSYGSTTGSTTMPAGY